MADELGDVVAGEARIVCKHLLAEAKTPSVLEEVVREGLAQGVGLFRGHIATETARSAGRHPIAVTFFAARRLVANLVGRTASQDKSVHLRPAAEDESIDRPRLRAWAPITFEGCNLKA